MGAWGPKIFDDDVAEDVRDFYMEHLDNGERSDKITKKLMEDFEVALNDPDDEPIIWFALADIQWNLGQLENFVKEKALYHIDIGHDLNRWKEENPVAAMERENELRNLKARLLSSHPTFQSR